MAAPRAYYGKPENQQNPKAPNMHGQNRADRAPNNPNAAPSHARVPKNDTPLSRLAAQAPRVLPAPQKSTATPSAPKDENLKDLTLFAVNQSVREVQPRITFTPAATGLIDVSRAIHQEYRSHDPNVAKVLTPEVMDYYSVALFWIRAIDLKAQFGLQLTASEDALLQIAQRQPLTIPAPLLSYLKSYGGILTKLESNLWPAFPDLPTAQIGALGGYYGPIAEDTHNLYEEIPCLGVLAYAVQQVLTQVNGAYPSLLTTADFEVNRNLLGYRPLARRRDEARSFIESCNITVAQFPSNVASTSFNLDLILATSEILRETKAFKVTTTNLTTLGSAGSQSQTVFLQSLPTPNDNSLVRTEVLPSCLGRESTSHLGMAIYTCSQLLKAAQTPAQAEPPQNTTQSWLCVTPLGEWVIPNAWIANRNQRRNLPIYWYNPVFTGPRQVPSETILGLVQRFTGS